MRNKYGALIGYTNELRYLLPHDFAHKWKYFNSLHEYFPALKIELYKQSENIDTVLYEKI